MNVIENEIKAAIRKELEAAKEVHGLHRSYHEKYAIVLEELIEAKVALKQFEDSFIACWNMTMADDSPAAIDVCYKDIADMAKDAAIEFCQVAAMCKKEVRDIPCEANVADHGEYSGHDSARVYHCDACKNDFVTTYPPYFCPMCGAEFKNAFMLKR